MDRLSPTSKFNLWKLRAIPTLEAKAKKMGLNDAAELLPTLLDDTLCTVYAQWLPSHKDPTLKEAIDFLESWLLNNKETSSDSFMTRKWLHGESLEEFASDLEALAASLHIKSSDRAFKAQFINGLPAEAQPFLRLQVTGTTWPSMTQLVDHAKALKIYPPARTSDFQSPPDTIHSSPSCGLNHKAPQPSRLASVRCFTCNGFGHMARICPSTPKLRHPGKGQRW